MVDRLTYIRDQPLVWCANVGGGRPNANHRGRRARTHLPTMAGVKVARKMQQSRVGIDVRTVASRRGVAGGL